MYKKLLSKNIFILSIIFALQICVGIIYSTVDSVYLYGTDDDRFYLWRFGAFSLFGVLVGAAVGRIPLEKLNRFWGGPQKWILSTIIAASVVLPCLSYILSSYGRRALSVWLNPSSDPDGSGYLYLYKSSMLRMSSLIGGSYSNLPPGYAKNDILVYAVSSIGIIPAYLIIVLGLALLAAFIFQYKMISVPICKYISALIVIYFAYAVIANSLSTFNMLPYNNSHFPFVSYDKFTLVFDMCLVGIFMRMTMAEVA